MPTVSTTVAFLPKSRFYSPRQIYVASFLGTPLAAAWFISCNHAALADHSRALRFLWLGVCATIIALAVGLLLPDKTPNLLWPILYSFLIYLWAQKVFDAPCAKHVTSGGLKGSWWIVVGVSVLADLVVLGAFLAITSFTPSLSTWIATRGT